MGVNIGEVTTFPHPKADHDQLKKISEEEHEVYGAWERLERAKPMMDYDGLGRCDYDQSREHLISECADLITATCNLLAALGVDDMRDAMDACEQRNRDRGRL